MRTTPATRAADPAPPPEPFTVETVVTLDDRVAAGLHASREIVRTGRRDQLKMQLSVGILILLLMAYGAWSESRSEGLEGFARAFWNSLVSPSGFIIGLIAIWSALLTLRYRKTCETQLRRWLRNEGHDRPTAVSYRFEPGGVIVTTTRGRECVACRRIMELSETAGHLLITLKDADDVHPLPRHALSGDDTLRIQLWARSCHLDGPGRNMPFEVLSQAAGSEAVPAARFTLNETDREAAFDWQLNRPGVKRQSRRFFAFAFGLSAVLPPLFIGAGWLIDPDRVPLAYALPLLAEMMWAGFRSVTLPLWAMCALLMLASPKVRRWQVRRHARRFQRGMKARDIEVRPAAGGLETEQDGILSVFDWSEFTAYEQSKDHLLLLRRDRQPLVLPLRALHGDQREQFERVFATRIGGGREADLMEA